MSFFKFIVVGGVASAIHWCISWWMFYHVLGGMTVLSTFSGYSGGWVCSYVGNRVWSFRDKALHTSIKGSSFRFVLSQLLAALVLVASTWLVQQLIIFYFSWYVLTNHIVESPSLVNFCKGASYPPALFAGMVSAAIVSYFMTRFFVFKGKTESSAG